MTTSPPATTRKPSPRRRRLRIAVRILAPFIILVLCVLVYFEWRRTAEYEGPLEGLLPSAPVAIANVRGLRDMLERVEASRAADLQSNIDLSALLLTDEDWREFQQDRDKPATRAKLAVARTFLKRCFGSDALVAIAPSESSERPGFLALTRSNIGFLDQVAELVAQLYPDLSLTTTSYRGVRVHQYAAEKSRHSFSFILIGHVVALSMRTPDTIYLHEIVDRYRDGIDEVGASSSAGEGLHLKAAPIPLLDALALVFERKFERDLTPEQQVAITELIAMVDDIDAHLTVDKQVTLTLEMQWSETGRHDAARLFPSASGCGRLAREVPADTALFVALSHRDPWETAEAIWNIVAAWPRERKWTRTWPEALEKASASCVKHVQVDLLALAASAIAPGSNTPVDLAIAATGLAPGLIPQPRIRLAVRNPDAAPDLSDAVTSNAVTLAGLLTMRQTNGALDMALGEPSIPATPEPSDSLAKSANWRALGLEDAETTTSIIVYADFKKLCEVSRVLVGLSFLMDEDDRADIIKTSAILCSLTVLEAAALTAEHSPDSARLALRFPLIPAE